MPHPLRASPVAEASKEDGMVLGRRVQTRLVVDSSGEDLDFINGYAFLKHFYPIFDTASKRVGLPTTRSPPATTN
ncbi:hypothetical protein DFH08DRAFT_951232 [Mycena albidolilacea]|uniref:Uncharacterized protein n=1 Tax=Mycena albidolilacea TaxID=1033008 RepID=A0AAD7AMS8_9AGAR|nr:hypothetical protein DFH08DRAFT_951232 [Mycena albidolilacea]